MCRTPAADPAAIVAPPPFPLPAGAPAFAAARVARRRSGRAAQRWDGAFVDTARLSCGSLRVTRIEPGAPATPFIRVAGCGAIPSRSCHRA